MIQFILMLLGLASGHHNAQSSTGSSDNKGQTITQDIGSEINPGDGTGGPVGGNTGQTPPPFTKP